MFKIALIALTLVACGTTPTPTPPIGPTPPGPPMGCLNACYHLGQLGCSTSVDLCERICESSTENQPDFPTCIGNAKSCSDADNCQ